MDKDNKMFEEESKRILNKDQIGRYNYMQKNQIKSRAYILAKKYGLEEEVAEHIISKLGYFGAIGFTESFFKKNLKDSDVLIKYIEAVEDAAKNKTYFFRNNQKISLLEQEIMNFQNKFNLDLNKIEDNNGYLSEEDGEHYLEHILNQLDKLED